jgi:hypothetical protein
LWQEDLAYVVRLGLRFWVAALAAGSAAAVLVGAPTVLIPNPIFARMTPARPVDYVVWLAASALLGVVLASYSRWATGVAAPLVPAGATGRLSAGSVLSFFAVGCPTCNKLVVLLLGSSGALSAFAPIQPVLGAASLALLGVTLWSRLRALGFLGGACTLPPPAPPAGLPATRSRAAGA